MSRMMEPGNMARALCLVFLCLVMFSGSVSAATITESPDHISRRGTVTISIHDLGDNAIFSLLIEGRFNVPAGSAFTFETGNFVMPISLSNGELVAYTENTQQTKFSVKKGGTEASVGKLATENGIFTYTEQRPVSAGTYDWMKISGTALPEKELIVTRLQLMGSKSGPDNSELSFTIDGIDQGSVFVTIFVNNQQALYKEITIGSGVPVVAPKTPGMMSGQTVAATTAATTAAARTLQTFTSVDGIVTLLAETDKHIGIVKVTPDNVPAEWMIIHGPYAVAPAGLSLSPAADLTFSADGTGGSAPSYAYFIAQYDAGQWKVITTDARKEGVHAAISSAGIYALMALKSESTVQVTTSGTQASGTQSFTTPKIASIAQGESQKQNLLPPGLIPVIGAILICILIMRRKIK